MSYFWVILLTFFILMIISSGFILMKKNSAIVFGFMTFILIGIQIFILYNVPFDYHDRENYTYQFLRLNNGSVSVLQQYLESSDALFYLIVYLITYITDNISTYYLLLYFLFITPILIFSFKVFGSKRGFIVIFCITLFSIYYSYFLNGIRQGIAMTLILLIILALKKNKPFVGGIISLIALGFHTSSIVFSAVLFIIKYFKFELNKLLLLYILTSLYLVITVIAPSLQIANVLNLGEFSYMTNFDMNRYGEATWFRIYLYNTGWLALFIFLKNKHVSGFNLLSIYLVFISIYNMFGSLMFSNRIAAYAWFLIPFITIYLVLQRKDDKYTLFLIMIGFLIMGLLTWTPFELLEFIE